MKDETHLSSPTEGDAVSVAVMTIMSGGLSTSLCDKGIQVNQTRGTSNDEHVTGEYHESSGTEKLLRRQDSDRSDSVRSVDQHTSNSQKGRRSGQKNSRHLRRSVSAREGERAPFRPKVKRSVSERGERSNRHHKHHRRQSQHGNQRGRRTSNSGIAPQSHLPFENTLTNSEAYSVHGSGKVHESVAVEIGLAEAAGVSPKETRRRQIVFAVVLISLGILTASVLLVAITLLITPATENVIRKENQEIYRIWSSTTTPQEGAQSVFFNQTVSSTG